MITSTFFVYLSKPSKLIKIILKTFSNKNGIKY